MVVLVTWLGICWFVFVCISRKIDLISLMIKLQKQVLDSQLLLICHRYEAPSKKTLCVVKKFRNIRQSFQATRCRVSL